MKNSKINISPQTNRELFAPIGNQKMSDVLPSLKEIALENNLTLCKYHQMRIAVRKHLSNE